MVLHPSKCVLAAACAAVCLLLQPANVSAQPSGATASAASAPPPTSSSSSSQPPREEQGRTEPVRSPFERELALAVYGTGHAGSYFAGGIGGRLRWEPFDWLGVEAYLEATLVDWPGGGLRHDYPNGFNVYVPIRLGELRFRPFFGFCDILSFVEPEEQGAPRADDVLFGLHAGVGAELALHSMLSLFADLQANVYMGHDRTVGGWTGGVDEELVPFWTLQLNLGAQLHVGRR